MIEGIVNLSDPRERETLVKSVRQLRGMVSVRIAQHRERRSNQANRRLWGVIYPAMVGFMAENGITVTTDECHEFWKNRLLRKTLVNPDTGEVYGETVGSTAGMDTKEFSEFMDAVERWLLDFGVEIPPPSGMRMEYEQALKR